MIRKLLSLAILLALLPVLPIGCSSKDDNPPGPTPVPEPRVIVQAHQDPTLDNAIDAPVWDSITAVEISIGNKAAYVAGTPSSVASKAYMKALSAGDSLLYIWTQWTDYSQNDRYGQLHATYVGPSNNPDWSTDTSIYNEDRFYVLFDEGAADGADCAAYCHASANTSGHKFYGGAGEDADIWQWRAQRGGIARYAIDMHLTDSMIAPDPFAQRPDSLNHGDSLYYGNYSEFFGYPKKMDPAGPDYEGAGLLQGVWVTFDKDLDWIVVPPDGPPYGKDIPGYFYYNVLLENQSDKGSRWDIRAVSSYDAGADTWTVVFRRKLTTADLNDINFGAITDSLAISIAIANNSGVDHSGHEPFYLIFQ